MCCPKSPIPPQRYITPHTEQSVCPQDSSGCCHGRGTQCYRPPTSAGRFTLTDLVACMVAALLLSAGSAMPAVPALAAMPCCSVQCEAQHIKHACQMSSQHRQITRASAGSTAMYPGLRRTWTQSLACNNGPMEFVGMPAYLRAGWGWRWRGA